ncbi:MAG: hypothetical protein B5M48_01135 [Candidatus Omnitrophica bacterium 4484_213]|nr:MAG: hypothetical protein B5M48_01135 [Candidatus Omnitrophica bacterium 4484_213]
MENQNEFLSKELKKTVPWERRKEVGFLKAFWQTWKEIILHPKHFFSKMPTEGGLSNPLFFGVITGYLPVILSIILGFLLAQLNIIGELGTLNLGIISVILLIFSPLAIVLGLFLTSAIFHFFFWIAGTKKGFETTFRIICYSNAVYIFQLLPLGQLIAGIWAIVLLCIGAKRVHTFTKSREKLAVIILLIIIGLGIAITIALPIITGR